MTGGMGCSGGLMERLVEWTIVEPAKIGIVNLGAFGTVLHLFFLIFNTASSKFETHIFLGWSFFSLQTLFSTFPVPGLFN